MRKCPLIKGMGRQGQLIIIILVIIGVTLIYIVLSDRDCRTGIEAEAGAADLGSVAPAAAGPQVEGAASGGGDSS